jgi:hypothetical protein
MRVLAMTVFAFAIAPISTRAQSTTPAAATVPPAQAVTDIQTSTSRGPTIQSAAAGFRLAPSTVADLNSAKPRRSAQHDAVVLIVVGVAAMAVGAFIGGGAGTVFLVGGAIIGLVGLYNLLE